MFEILKDPQFDFMGRRRALMGLSLVCIVASLGILAVRGLNFGIEFTGGTELQLKYEDRPNISAIRSTLAAAGMSGSVVTTIGDVDEHEVTIRLPQGAVGADAEDPTRKVLEALRGAATGRRDVNIDDEATIAGVLRGAPGIEAVGAETLAESILEERKERAIFHDFDELAALPGMTPEILRHFESNVQIGPLALRSQSYIGPAVGRELIQKALFAVLGSLIGMLIYIWIRFHQLQWGLGALVALTHDTIITLGLFSLFGQELSLSVVAAFLTLIGYSVNDTVVVFDRIRENLAHARGGDLAQTINMSINQTLSRTIITGGSTWIVVFVLYLFGGAALRPFAFVLTAGVIIGTYSSICIAAPILITWKSYFDRRKRGTAGGASGGGAGAGAGEGERAARKVRRSSAV